MKNNDFDYFVEKLRNNMIVEGGKSLEPFSCNTYIEKKANEIYALQDAFYIIGLMNAKGYGKERINTLVKALQIVAKDTIFEI